jgi:hypothetical protein
MADNFFRPGFTQGVWANGEPVKGLNYLAFVGNGLNTLNISANKIDTNLLLSGSVWWEPLGAYSEPGKSRQMYDDYFASKKTRIRIGSSFTRSREDRFSEIDQSSPDNTSIYNSDGVLAFATGAFAPGVTVQEATYRMWAIDGGLKKSGFSVNGQYYFRWLNDFDADGPLPLASTFDHGFELSTGQFIVPKTLVLYARGSKVFGQFGSPYEYAGGFKWYFLPTERVWLTGELMRVHKAPYSGAFTPYTAGMTGWVPMIQTVLAFWESWFHAPDRLNALVFGGFALVALTIAIVGVAEALATKMRGAHVVSAFSTAPSEVLSRCSSDEAMAHRLTSFIAATTKEQRTQRRRW